MFSSMTTSAITSPPPSYAEVINSASRITVADFLTYLKTISHTIVLNYASTFAEQLDNQAKLDLKKCLFHIMRNEEDGMMSNDAFLLGVTAGSCLFALSPEKLSTFDPNRFKKNVEEYLVFLQVLSRVKPEVGNFTAANEVFTSLNKIEFPHASSSQLDASQAPVRFIDVKALHKRQLCVPCGNNLNGTCTKGDSCKFCHDPVHTIKAESSNNARP